MKGITVRPVVVALFIIMSLITLIAIRELRDTRTSLSEAVSAQAPLKQNIVSLAEANDALSQENDALFASNEAFLEYAGKKISDLGREANSLAAQYLPGLNLDGLTAHETFSIFAEAINEGDWPTAYLLTDSDYQETCSLGQFTNDIKASRFKFPPMQFRSEIILPEQKLAVVTYDILQNGEVLAVGAVLLLDTDGYWAVASETENCGGAIGDSIPVPSMN